MRDCSWVTRWFENLRQEPFECSSDRTDDRPNNGYNCIAYAAGKTDKWWWPVDDPSAYWPEGLPREPLGFETLGNFIKAFESEGYLVCADGEPEDGFEKVALFSSNTGPTHAARLLPEGRWVSKLGKLEDIKHKTVHSVEGLAYGKATTFLKRPNPEFKWDLKNQLKLPL
jgi:hypothetical protein